MVGAAIDGVDLRSGRLHNAGDIAPQAFSGGRPDVWGAVLGRENDVEQNAGEGLGHRYRTVINWIIDVLLIKMI